MHMVKIFVACLLLFVICINKTQSQNYNWITPNKTYLKMYVAEDAMYRITRTDFTSAGITTTGIDPRTVKVYNRGNQIPIFFQGESDGVFDASDYLDFYGTRNYGGLTKTYDEANALIYTTNEYYDFYSDTNAYWIDWGGANGIRMPNSGYATSSLFPDQYFMDLVHLEKDKSYWLGEINANNGNFTNEKYKGEGWYWSLLGNNATLSDTFSTPLLNSSAQTSSVRIFAYPQSIDQLVPNEHTLQIFINGNLISSIIRDDYSKIDTTINFLSSLLSSSSVNSVSAKYIANSGSNGTMFVDLFEIKYPKNFRFRNNQCYVSLSGTDTTSRQFKLLGYSSANPASVYDIKNGIRITGFTSSADTLKFTGKGNSSFEVINKNIAKKPFRIIQRIVPNLASASNGADYLIVYNSIFESQVLQLKNLRETNDNFRVAKAEIQDIYDIFNYGIENPVAVRNFGKYVYDNWQTPRFKYLCLFGRASLDPKKNSSSTIYEKNLIPSSGNPTSDNYFANFNPGSFTFYSQVAVGRFSVYNTAEAQAMINNLTTYETQPPQSWWKTFTFIGGGVNPAEQITIKRDYDTLINRYIIPKPLSSNRAYILRDDLNSTLTFNYPDSIENQINRGTLMVNFVGHAGSQDWELGMSDPNVLSNFDGKFPLVLSMTCYTGKIAEPAFKVFGEKFMTMSNRGAIGYIGSSGWGFIGAGFSLNDNIYKVIARDTVRRIGDILSNSVNALKEDSIYFNFRHTINCYTLQGDPAAKLLLPVRPEYSISQSDYKLSDNFPDLKTPSTLTIYPKNYGTFADSCKIRLQILKDYTKYFTKDTTLRNFRYSDSAKFTFSLDSNGEYTMKVILDFVNENPYEYKNDNTLNFTIKTKTLSFIPLKPENNAVIKTDSVEFTGLNPYLNKNKYSVKVLLELDSTKNFNSPLKQMFASSSVQNTSTKFKTLLPRTDSNIVYFWRTNSIIDGDSTGWTTPFNFRYNPLISLDEKDEIPQDTLVTIYKNKSSQYNDADFYNTNSSVSGIKLNSFSGNLSVRSLGSNGSEASYFSVLSKSIHIDGGLNAGLSIVKVRKLDGAILQHKVFKMQSSNSSDSVLNFLNTFDTTHYIMALTAAYVPDPYVLLNTATKNKFHQFGSTKVDSVRRFGWWDSWSFIGFLNATPAQTSEDYHSFITNVWSECNSSLDKTFNSSSGTVSYQVGPANSWKDFSWKNTIVPGSGIKFDVYGIDRSGLPNLLLSNLTTGNLINLSAINALTYPRLNLIGKLDIDTVTGTSSSTLTSFKLNYTPPAELAVDLSTFAISDSILSPGRSEKLSFTVQNSGRIKAPGYVVNVYYNSVDPRRLLKTDSVSRELPVEGFQKFKGEFTIPELGNAQLANFVAEVVPLGQKNESHTFNNLVYFTVKLANKTVASKISLFSDGNLVNSGDYVSLKPEFKISLDGDLNQKVSRSDTSQLVLLLNGKQIKPSGKGGENSMLKNSKLREEKIIPIGSDNSFTYHPILNTGENKVKIIYRIEESESDTAEYDVIVSDRLQVKEFYNFPNPMKNETSFIFSLIGAEVPQNIKIKVYTITGRLVKEISYTPKIGFNQIPWDGRDNDGDFIANGTYLYKLVTEDKLENETGIQKMVVLR